MSAPALTGFASVLTVTNVAAALAYYVDVLHFTVQFQMGSPASYAIIERGHVSLHLMPVSQDPATLGCARVYVYAAGVDALQAEFRARGCAIEVEAQDFAYGMREFSVRDPDGNRLTFGEPVAAPA